MWDIGFMSERISSVRDRLVIYSDSEVKERKVVGCLGQSVLLHFDEEYDA